MAEVASDVRAAEHQHPPHLQHHFDTPAQQFDASKLGVWVFLVTEILFFGGLFCAYAVYRHNHPEIFAIGRGFLDVRMGAVNTVVLILSSLTMASAVYFAQKSNRKPLAICLSLTLLGGCTFMGIKAIEYADKIKKGKVWGETFSYHEYYARHHADQLFSDQSRDESAQAIAAAEEAGSAAGRPKLERSDIKPAALGPQGLVPPAEIVLAEDERGEKFTLKDLTRKDLHIFMGVYFCLTGLHGIHVLAGIGLITWLLVGTLRGRYNEQYYTPVDLGGLYWHLVDMIWIYLFPLLYLIH